MSKVNVYEGLGGYGIVARVERNDILDYWDGSNWTSGSTGHHLGITRLRDGRYVLIYGTQWQGERDSAEVVTDEEALQAILRSDHEELLDKAKFAPLKKLADKMPEEVEDDE